MSVSALVWIPTKQPHRRVLHEMLEEKNTKQINTWERNTYNLHLLFDDD